MVEGQDWDVHEVGVGTDPMELAAVVFEWDHERREPMPTQELRERFGHVSMEHFYKLLQLAEDEGLIRTRKRFADTALVYPLRMV